MVEVLFKKSSWTFQNNIRYYKGKYIYLFIILFFLFFWKIILSNLVWNFFELKKKNNFETKIPPLKHTEEIT